MKTMTCGDDRTRMPLLPQQLVLWKKANHLKLHCAFCYLNLHGRLKKKKKRADTQMRKKIWIARSSVVNIIALSEHTR